MDKSNIQFLFESSSVPSRASLMAQWVKNLLATQETQLPYLGQDPLRRQWHPILVFLPEKSHRQRNLVGHSPWGHKRVRND